MCTCERGSSLLCECKRHSPLDTDENQDRHSVRPAVLEIQFLRHDRSDRPKRRERERCWSLTVRRCAHDLAAAGAYGQSDKKHNAHLASHYSPTKMNVSREDCVYKTDNIGCAWLERKGRESSDRLCTLHIRTRRTSQCNVHSIAHSLVQTCSISDAKDVLASDRFTPCFSACDQMHQFVQTLSNAMQRIRSTRRRRVMSFIRVFTRR